MNDQNKTRDIPPMPGGGSWTFDDSTWSWISNDPVPVPAADAEPVHNNIPAEE